MESVWDHATDGAAFPRAAVSGRRGRLRKFSLALAALALAALPLAPPARGQRAGKDSARVGARPFGPSQDAGESVLLAEAEGPFKLGVGAVRVALRPAAGRAAEGLLASRLGAGRKIYVVVRDLRTDEQPGVLYHVYLDLPAGATPGKNDPHYVGALNFFNSAYGGAAANPDFLFSYDATPVARKLRARGLLAARTTLTILPAGVPEAGATPTVGRVELVEQ